MFVNLTNHPSTRWSDKQLAAAYKYSSEIIDIPFPLISAVETEDQLDERTNQIFERIIAIKPAAVCCQGEMTLTYRIVNRLKGVGILTLAACSDRRVIEQVDEKGITHKVSQFEFVQFRSY